MGLALDKVPQLDEARIGKERVERAGRCKLARALSVGRGRGLTRGWGRSRRRGAGGRGRCGRGHGARVHEVLNRAGRVAERSAERLGRLLAREPHPRDLLDLVAVDPELLKHHALLKAGGPCDPVPSEVQLFEVPAFINALDVVKVVVT